MIEIINNLHALQNFLNQENPDFNALKEEKFFQELNEETEMIGCASVMMEQLNRGPLGDSEQLVNSFLQNQRDYCKQAIETQRVLEEG